MPSARLTPERSQARTRVALPGLDCLLLGHASKNVDGDAGLVLCQRRAEDLLSPPARQPLRALLG